MKDHIANAIERLEHAVAHRPRFGVGTAHAVTTLGAGLTATTEDGPWRIAVDLPERLGGTATAPSPSALLRAALGSCMAMTYRMRAARSGVTLTAVRVTVETDSAIAGMLLTDSAEPAGFGAVRFHVEVESPDPAPVVRRILDEGDRLSPVLDDLSRSVPVARTTTIRTVPATSSLAVRESA